MSSHRSILVHISTDDISDWQMALRNLAKVTRMAEAGVELAACTNSLDRFGHATAALATGVSAVRSGVAEVVRAQQQADTYLKLP